MFASVATATHVGINFLLSCPSSLLLLVLLSACHVLREVHQAASVAGQWSLLGQGVLLPTTPDHHQASYALVQETAARRAADADIYRHQLQQGLDHP